MPADPREDALDWGDPDDPSWVDPGRDDVGDAASEPAHDDERAAGDEGQDARGASTAPVATAASADDRRRSAITAATGLLGGVYLAFTIGWILSIDTLPLTGATLLIEVLYQFGEFLAIIAGALWFGTVMALTRGGRPAARLGWLALGTLVLVPWPLILAVTA